MLEVGYRSISVDEDGDYTYLWYVNGKTIEDCDKRIFDGLDKWGIKY